MRLSSLPAGFAALPLLAALVVLVATLFGAAGLVLLSRHRRRTRSVVADHRLLPIQRLCVARWIGSRAERGGVASEADELPEPGTEDGSSVLGLRLHIRALETALEQEAGRVEELQAMVAGGESAQHRDVRRMLATLEGLRVEMTDDVAAERVLARVEAAFARLLEASSIGRTVLAAAPAPMAPAQSPSALAEEPAVSGAENTSQMAGEQLVTAVLPVIHDGPATSAFDDEVVLPIPAEAVEEPSARGRRRRWGRAA